jgi:tRNA(fMet)-specific endonuclease VapC
MRYLFDANAVIALLKDPGGPLGQHARKHRPADIGLPSIVIYELYFGAFKSQRRAHNMSIVDSLQFEIVPFDKEDARQAGEIRATLEALGTPIGPYDVLIAGQACARNLVLVSRNVREFQRVNGLAVENWEG